MEVVFKNTQRGRPSAITLYKPNDHHAFFLLTWPLLYALDCVTLIFIERRNGRVKESG
jgi:hypothetical protein